MLPSSPLQIMYRLAVVQDEHDGAPHRCGGRDLHLAHTGERQVQQHGEGLVGLGGRRQHAAEALDDAGGHEDRGDRAGPPSAPLAGGQIAGQGAAAGESGAERATCACAGHGAGPGKGGSGDAMPEEQVAACTEEEGGLGVYDDMGPQNW
ncbi:hypothetical protein PVAP13_6KG025235 [Panicum virgatum]|uniref:Uncharacterized protein n=1 Tax=Panicum virgatum TaxID=38727 RepID=A0A8T0R6N3_PANVG|nr:hypothetical protein PVAP13_6KG025235 [Panicum virgatum]